MISAGGVLPASAGARNCFQPSVLAPGMKTSLMNLAQANIRLNVTG